jgi:hypothetical protein
MWTVIGTIAVVLATIVAGLFLERRFGPKRLTAAQTKQLPAPGDSPSTAMLVTAGELRKLRVQTCCKATMAVTDDHVRFDERDLLVLHFACAHCNAKRTLYIRS